MKKNHYKSFIVLLVVIFITVLSCSRNDSEDEQVPNIPNITTPTNDTNPKDTGNTLDTTNDTAINNNPNYSLYNLYQAQSVMHWLNPTDTCSVGYDINPYKNIRSKACGIESERHECKSCRHPNFGVESDKIINNYIFRKDYKGINPNDPDIDATCLSHIKEIQNEVKRGCPPNIHAYVTYVSGYYTDNTINTFHTVKNKSNVIAICKYAVNVIELKYNESKNCKICGSIDETTYKLCKHPSNGIEETVLKSSLDLSKQDVERLEGKVLGCKTCDDIKFDILNMDENNDTQLVNRINCLLNNLDSSNTNNEDKQGIITELKRLTIYSDLINQKHPELFTKIKEHI